MVFTKSYCTLHPDACRGEPVALVRRAVLSLRGGSASVLAAGCVCRAASWPNAQRPQWCCWRWDSLLAVRGHLLHRLPGPDVTAFVLGACWALRKVLLIKTTLGLLLITGAHGDEQENHSALCVSKLPQMWLLLQSRADDTRYIMGALFHAGN